MKRTAPLLAVALVLLAGVALPAGGSATRAPGTAGPAAQAESPTGTNESDESAAPGARLAGVVAFQGAEVEGEVEGRAFGNQVARANWNGSKAEAVADRFEELTRRMDELRERKRALAEARENGSISTARYRAELAALAARTTAVERQANQTEAATRDLPTDVLESKGVNATAIERLRNDSRQLTGPETAAIARTIAGPGAGGALGAANVTRGPPLGVPGGPGAPNASGGGAGPPDREGDDRPTPRNSPPVTAGEADPGRPTDAGSGGNSTGPASSPGKGGPPTDAGPPSDSGRPTDAGSGGDSTGSDGSPGGGGPPTDAGPPAGSLVGSGVVL
jgi:hypothetical protein